MCSARLAISVTCVGRRISCAHVMDSGSNCICTCESGRAPSGCVAACVGPDNIGWMESWLAKLIGSGFVASEHFQMMQALVGNQAAHECIALEISVHPEIAKIVRENQLPSGTFQHLLELSLYISHHLGCSTYIDLLTERIRRYNEIVQNSWLSDDGVRSGDSSYHIAYECFQVANTSERSEVPSHDGARDSWTCVSGREVCETAGNCATGVASTETVGHVAEESRDFKLTDAGGPKFGIASAVLARKGEECSSECVEVVLMPNSIQKKATQKLCLSAEHCYGHGDAQLDMAGHKAKDPVSPLLIGFAECTLRGQKCDFSGKLIGRCNVLSFGLSTSQQVKEFFQAGVYSFPCKHFGTCAQWLFFRCDEFHVDEKMEGYIAKYSWEPMLAQVKETSCQRCCICPSCKVSDTRPFESVAIPATVTNINLHRDCLKDSLLPAAASITSSDNNAMKIVGDNDCSAAVRTAGDSGRPFYTGWSQRSLPASHCYVKHQVERTVSLRGEMWLEPPQILQEVRNHVVRQLRRPVRRHLLASLGCVVKGLLDDWSGQPYGECEVWAMPTYSCDEVNQFLHWGVYSFPCWNFNECGQWLFFRIVDVGCQAQMDEHIHAAGWHRTKHASKSGNRYCTCPFCPL